VGFQERAAEKCRPLSLPGATRHLSGSWIHLRQAELVSVNRKRDPWDPPLAIAPRIHREQLKARMREGFE